MRLFSDKKNSYLSAHPRIHYGAGSELLEGKISCIAKARRARCRRLFADARGFTLVEMVVTVAITGVIVVFLGTAVFQMTTVTAYGNDKLTAMHELQNAAHWFNIDGQQSTAAVIGSGLDLTQSDNSSIRYSLVGTELCRTAGGSQMILARNISDASFSIAGRLITMAITSAPPGRYSVVQSGNYQVYLRPAEDGS